MYDPSWIQWVLLAAVIYLIYKVHRLEQLLGSGRRSRPGARPTGQSKVIPLLKDDIEPGPFKAGNRRREERPPEQEP